MAEKYVSASWQLGQHGEVADHLGQIYEKRGDKDSALRTYALAISALRPIPETHDRLAALAGGNAKADAAVAKYKEELQRSRTIDLGKVAKETGSAEFFVLLSRGAGEKASSSSEGAAAATVEGVKFAGGDEKLRVFTEALRTAEYPLKFPDDTPVKILRRGVLSCSTATGTCSFVLMLPEDVRNVD
jgi:hypothetical protein